MKTFFLKKGYLFVNVLHFSHHPSEPIKGALLSGHPIEIGVCCPTWLSGLGSSWTLCWEKIRGRALHDGKRKNRKKTSKWR